MKNVIESAEKRQQKLEKQFNELISWIQAHLSEQIGWAELMSQSGLDHQTLQALFFKYKSTTPMTWIRLQRQASQQVKAVYKPSFSPLLGKAS
jgi:transcriptional regulator GlxA family with amidase domain